MARTKKIGFDQLPAAVERILEILENPDNSAAAIPELINRIDRLENKIDYLQKKISPESAMMDKQTVLRTLKIRPAVLNELVESGVLPTCKEGRSTLFYEDAVVKYFMTGPKWTAAVSETAPAEVEAEPLDLDGKQRVDISTAAKITGRSNAAIYQLTSTKAIPFHKDGAKVYFIVEELQEWIKTHPPRKRKQQ